MAANQRCDNTEVSASKEQVVSANKKCDNAQLSANKEEDVAANKRGLSL